jgi:hypothetical protein
MRVEHATQLSDAALQLSCGDLERVADRDVHVFVSWIATSVMANHDFSSSAMDMNTHLEHVTLAECYARFC